MFNLKKSGIAAVAVTAVAAMLGSFGLAAPALADETATTADATGSITVNEVQGGATVTAYKIIDINYDRTTLQPLSPQYTWDDAVASWVEGYDSTNGVDYIGKDNAVTSDYAKLQNDLSGAPKKDGSYSSDIAKFYDQLSNALGKGKLALVPAGSATAAGAEDSTTVVLDKLPVAGYFVKITNKGGNTEGNVGSTVADYSYRPVAVTVGLDQEDGKPWEVVNATINAKRSKANIDKSVNENSSDHNSGKNEQDTGSDTVGIGSDVRFDLRSDVPVFPKDAIEKKYVIVDTMDNALTPKYGDTFKVWGYNDNKFPTDGSDEKNVLTAGTDYTLTEEKATDLDGNAVTWRLDFNYENIRKYDYIHVEYHATVNENAKVDTAIPNQAKLQYTNNPYEENSHRTIPDEVKLYTFGIKVLKQFYDNGKLVTGTLPKGAEFAVYRGAGSTTKLEFVKQGDNYRPKTDKDAASAVVTDLPVDSTGHIHVYGLNKGSYELEETQAPTGYAKLAGRIAVTITPQKNANGEYTGGVDGEDSKVEGETPEVGFVSTVAGNSRGWLPKTGSAGMVVMTVAGVLLVAAGVTVLARKRRA